MNTCGRQEMRDFSSHSPSSCVKNEPIGMAYVPWQNFHSVYDPDKALMCGTIFSELNKPFLGKRGACQL